MRLKFQGNAKVTQTTKITKVRYSWKIQINTIKARNKKGNNIYHEFPIVFENPPLSYENENISLN